MRRTRWAVIAVLVLVGAVWIGQGTGLLQGSSIMVGDPFWAFAGLALVLAGGVLAAVSPRGAARDPPLPGRLVPAGGDLAVEADERRRSRPGFAAIRSTISVSSMRR